jgi:DinB superfamily
MTEMNAGQPLVAAVLAKIHEQLERTGHLICRLPDNRLDWTAPLDGAWPAGLLVGHLLECVAGICAVLATAEPERLAHFAELRKLPVNHHCPPDEAVNQLRLYRVHIDEGFSLLTDTDLGRRLPTLFVQAGEPILTLLLGNLEHLINHKHQLFTYLKLMGIDVDSGDLYWFRGRVK